MSLETGSSESSSHEYQIIQKTISVFVFLLYFVSSRERPWRHWARSRIHGTRGILYASIPVFLNTWENTQVARAMISVFLWNARWRHGRSRGETKYRFACNEAYMWHDYTNQCCSVFPLAGYPNAYPMYPWHQTAKPCHNIVYKQPPF